MSEQIKGVIEGVSCKEGNDHPKYGMSYQTSIKVKGEWYGAFTKKTADELGLEKGKLVTFTYTENGKYKNFDPKSLSVSAAAKAEAEASGDKPAASKGYSGGGNTAGIKVGHAINNAVNLVASGKVPVEGSVLRTVHTVAVQIIALSVKLEGQYDDVVAKAAEVYSKATGNGAAPASEAPAATTTTPKAKAAAKPKAKPAPAPAPEPEPEEEEAPPVQQETQAEPDFDDDIPFNQEG